MDHCYKYVQHKSPKRVFSELKQQEREYKPENWEYDQTYSFPLDLSHDIIRNVGRHVGVS